MTKIPWFLNNCNSFLTNLLQKKVSYVIKSSRRKFYINAYFTVKECKMRFVANNNLILKWCKDIMIFDGLDILQLLVRYFCLIYEGGEVMDIKSMGIKTHRESFFVLSSKVITFL